VPFIKQSPGLLAYYVLDEEEDGTFSTVSIFEEREQLQRANSVAAGWIKQFIATRIATSQSLDEFSLQVDKTNQGTLYEGISEPILTQSLRLLSIQEVSEVLGMGRSWVYQQIRTGEMPSVQLGGSIKVRRQDLEEYIHKHRRSNWNEETNT
jgi:excisionase family DNA binding protein